jgi:hypothetical protein
MTTAFQLFFSIRHQEGPWEHGTREFVIYADDFNLLAGNVNIIKKTEALSCTSTEVGLELNAEKPSIRPCVVSRL